MTDPDLRSSILHDEAVCRSALGEHRIALELITEAVAIRRGLLDETVGRRLELAESLNNFADTLHDLGQESEAVAPATEAVALCERVASLIGPDNARMHIICLLTLADVASGKVRADAVRRAQELAGDDEELRQLVERRPDPPDA
jgi:hypothetical protein